VLADGDHQQRGPLAGELGSGSVRDDVERLVDNHANVMPMLRTTVGDMTAAVDLIVERLSAGGRLLYVGAGTSGWLAALDAAEVVVTFGMAGRVDSIVGGGHLLDPVALTLGDDAVDSIADDPVLSACGAADLVLAVSASGSTPFTVAAVDRARSLGAGIIAVVSQENSPLAERADVVILACTPDEIVSGSTRLTAGLAQKVVLNTLSTVSMVRLGRTMDGQMVCVEPLNEKLRQRIVRAISTATGVDAGTVRDVLEEAGSGDVAVVALTCSIDVDAARARLQRHHGNIHSAVSDS
jgi:N-acetylmuramic acid 6-phosphate etherase